MGDRLDEVSYKIGQLDAKQETLIESVDEIKELLRRNQERDEDRDEAIRELKMFQKKIAQIIAFTTMVLGMVGYGIWYIVTAFVPDLLKLVREVAKRGLGI